MRIVIVKHENCGQKYLFEVPVFEVPDGRYVSAGDLVRVSTKKGEKLATCLCDYFEVDENSDMFENILATFGASKPLAMVVGKYMYSEFEIKPKENSENN